MTFSKPALSIPDQRLKLEGRGLIIPDAARAERYLGAIGYYRLSAYTRPFQSDLNTHAFQDGVTFDDVLNLYIFDRQLRLTLLDALERVEVAVRTRINDVLCARKGNSHWYTDPDNFKPYFDHARFMAEIQRHQDDFVTNYRSKYDAPTDLPSWMAFQTLSFGACSKALSSLLKRDQEAVCDTFGLQPRPMITWVYALSVLRNHAAHHSRTWNRTYHVNLPLGVPLPASFRGILTSDNKDTLDGYALVLDAFMQHLSPGSRWWLRLSALVQTYHDSSPHAFHRADVQFRAAHLLTLPTAGGTL